MPNPNALWIVTTAADSAPAEQVADLNEVLSTGGASIMGGSGRLGQAVSIEFPEFKVSVTLSNFGDPWRGFARSGGAGMEREGSLIIIRQRLGSEPSLRSQGAGRGSLAYPGMDGQYGEQGTEVLVAGE
jgi:hypothetical protein